MFFVPTNIFLPMTPLIMRTQGLLFFGANVDTVQKTIAQSTQWKVSIPNTSHEETPQV